MENVKEYIVLHETKWDDIYDENGNVVMPRKNNYWLEGFWGIDDCKDWVTEGHQKGSKMGAVTLENIFAVCRDRVISLENCEVFSDATIIVCVKTSENVHRWKEVSSQEEAYAFVETFNNVVEAFVFTAFDIEVID